MNRIARLLAERGKRKLLVPFFTYGYPTPPASGELISHALESGADMLEIGIPFSDPLADGPEIQLSSQIALEQGATLARILTHVKSLRSSTQAPVVLMGYLNPILADGLDRFVRDATEAGVDGLIIPDLPADESEEFRNAFALSSLSLIFLVAPTTIPKRIRLIDSLSSTFVYAVTVAGVTGVTGREKDFGESTDTYLKSLRSRLSRPFVAGFGINSPERAERVCRWSDGVVVGSALVRLLADAPTLADGRKRVEQLLISIRRRLDEQTAA